MATGGETVTYGELERRANRLAHYLRAVGSSASSSGCSPKRRPTMAGRKSRIV